jgi:hypothetical protein
MQDQASFLKNASNPAADDFLFRYEELLQTGVVEQSDYGLVDADLGSPVF